MKTILRSLIFLFLLFPMLAGAAVTSLEPSAQLVSSDLVNNSDQVVALSSSNFGLTGPFVLSGQYSKNFGYSVKGSWAQLLFPATALNLVFEYGKNQRRLSATLGQAFFTSNRLKFTAERLWQNLSFDFDSGDVTEMVAQNAFGLTYEYLVSTGFFRDINLNASYSKANSKDLGWVDFVDTDNVLTRNYRNIAGGEDKSLSAGLDLHPMHSNVLGLQLNYDALTYKPLYDTTSKNVFGLGVTVNLQQLITDHIKLQLSMSNRKIYKDYQTELDFLIPSGRGGRLELGVAATRITGVADQPNDNRVLAHARYTLDAAANQAAAKYNLDSNGLDADLLSWTITPAVYMQAVLAVKDQKNIKFYQPSITLTDLQVVLGKAIDISLIQYITAGFGVIKNVFSSVINLYGLRFVVTDDGRDVRLVGVPKIPLIGVANQNSIRNDLSYPVDMTVVNSADQSSSSVFNLDLLPNNPVINPIPNQLLYQGSIADVDLTQYIYFGDGIDHLTSVDLQSDLRTYGLDLHLSSDGKKLTLDSFGKPLQKLTTAAVPVTFTVSSLVGASLAQTFKLDIKPAVPVLVSIALKPADPVIDAGVFIRFTAIGTYSDSSSKDITTQITTWKSSDDSVAKSAGGGAYTTYIAGKVDVSAALGAISGKTTLTVLPATLVSIEVTPSTQSLIKGKTEQYKAEGTYTDGTKKDLTLDANTRWDSTNKTIVTIDSQGLAIGVGVGVVAISATNGRVTGYTKLTVTSAVLESIALTPEDPEVAAGLPMKFIAIGTYSDRSTQDITTQISAWKSSDETIAQSTGGGTYATFKKVGKVGVQAILGALSGKTDLTVLPATLVSIAVTPASTDIAKGKSVQYQAIGTYSDSTTKDLTLDINTKWQSADITIATIDNKGLAKGVAAGTTRIAATNGAISGHTSLAVGHEVLESIRLTPADPQVPAGVAQRFTAIGTYSDSSSKDVTSLITVWGSTDEAIATSTGGGTYATFKKVGQVDVSATLGAIVGKTSLKVTQAELASIDVTPATKSIAKGTQQQYKAEGTYTDGTKQDLTVDVNTKWKSADTTIATLDTEGAATGVGLGTVIVSATNGSVVGDATLNVTKAELVSIDVSPATTNIAKGTTQQYTATGTFSDGSKQVIKPDSWHSTKPLVATINATGFATAVDVGTTSITANKGAISGSTDLTVTSATLVSIAVTPISQRIAKGTSLQYQAEGTYTDGTKQIITPDSWDSSKPLVATINSTGQAIAKDVGTTSITANKGAISGSTDLTVTSATLVSIAVTPISQRIAKGTSLQYQAEGTYTDGTKQIITPDSWDSSKPLVATINSTGKAIAKDVGTTSITANRGAISGSTDLTVTSATLVSITVTPASTDIAKGKSVQYQAIGTYSDSTTQDLTLDINTKWQSADITIATIDNKGLAKGVAEGATIIAATNGTVSGHTSLAVGPEVLESIRLTPADPQVPAGVAQEFTAIGTYSDSSSKDVTSLITVWGSTDEAIATSTGGGTYATFKKVGQVDVSATLGAIVGKTSLKVTQAELASIDVTPATKSIAKGTQQQYKAEGTYTDGTKQDLTLDANTKWESSDTTIATLDIDNKGLATGVGLGSAIIAATNGSVAGDTKLTVTQAELVSIDVSPATTSIAKGTKQQYTATGTYTDSSTNDITSSVNWSSSDVTNAPISNTIPYKGLATGAGVTPVGQDATITATLSSISATAKLTVKQAELVSIAVTPLVKSIAKGTTQQYTATGTYTDLTTTDITSSVDWSSSDVTHAPISNSSPNKGLATGQDVTALDEDATITARLGSIFGTATLTVTEPELVSIDVLPVAASIAKGTTQQYTATGTYTDSSTGDITTKVDWSSSDVTNAPISNTIPTKGLATGAGVTPVGQDATITATLSSISATAKLTVRQAELVSIDVSPAAASIAKGTTQQYTATGTYTDSSTGDITTTVDWSSSDVTNAPISNTIPTKGLATGAGVTAVGQDATITATLSSISATAKLTVKQAELVSIAVTPPTASVLNGKTQQYTATGIFSDGSQEAITPDSWNSADTTIATIDGAGLATATGVGSTTITATKGGISGTASLTVTPLTLLCPDAAALGGCPFPGSCTIKVPDSGGYLYDFVSSTGGVKDKPYELIGASYDPVTQALTCVYRSPNLPILLFSLSTAPTPLDSTNPFKDIAGETCTPGGLILCEYQKKNSTQVGR